MAGSRSEGAEALRRAAEELDFAAHPELLAGLAARAGPAWITLDPEGRVAGWSEGAERLFGLPRAEVVGRRWDALRERGWEDLRDLALAERPGDEVLACELRTCHPGGAELRLLCHARALGRPRGTLVLCVDATAAVEGARPAGARPEPAAFEHPAGMIGTSGAMRLVVERLRLAARSDVTVLITGESGTGKELAARALHSESPRCERPFVAVNCSAIPETLLESELFGHVQGSFTGAHRDRTGLFESAQGGTLFLDEIGDVSPLLQVKLLRVLQERQVVRVGDTRPRAVDVRLVTATHRDLARRVREGEMREDFYYRIRVFEVHMPPLRERGEDIPALARHLIARACHDQGRAPLALSRGALDALLAYPWPGNVRELYNAVEHALVLCRGATIDALDLPERVRRGARGGQAIEEDDPRESAERERLLEALEQHGWNRTRTAEALGMSRVTLWKRIRRYRLDEGVFRRGSRDELPGEHRSPGERSG